MLRKKSHPRAFGNQDKRSLRAKFGHLRVTYVMAFSRILADDVVDAIFDEDFGLSDGDESEFKGNGNNIHALLQHCSFLPLHQHALNCKCILIFLCILLKLMLLLNLLACLECFNCILEIVAALYECTCEHTRESLHALKSIFEFQQLFTSIHAIFYV